MRFLDVAKVYASSGAGGNGLRGGFYGISVRRLNGDDEFARIGKMFLVHFKPLHCGNARGQQGEHVSLEMQPGQSHRHRNEQNNPPPA